MQNRKRDTDVQNRLLDSVGEGEDGMFHDSDFHSICPLMDNDKRLVETF